MSNKKSDDATAVEMAPLNSQSNGAAAAAAAAASSGNDDSKPADAPTTSTSTTVNGSPATGESLAASLLSLPMSPAVFVSCGLLSAFCTMRLISAVREDPTYYTQGTATQPAELSAGQLMAFLVCFFVCSLFAGVQVMVLKEYVTALVRGRGGSNNDFGFPTIIHPDSPTVAPLNNDYVIARRNVISDTKYDTLMAGFQFVACLLLFFLCDRTKFLHRGGKTYVRDQFWFLCVVFLLVGLGTLKKAVRPRSSSSSSKAKDGAAADASAAPKEGGAAGDAASVPVPANVSENLQVTNSSNNSEPDLYHVPHLQRDQTEEWKGWMQVMFLWYHYFNAKEIYNVIRLYIAAYVWMTGFGNFSYYYTRKDFSFLRFMSMQWRLNFLVFWVCLIMQNEYMLYYICMLHTTFTVFIYIALGIYPQANQTFGGCCAKFAIVTVLSILVWDVSDDIFDLVWLPLKPLVQFHNPYKPSQDVMHEWRFRSKLDHLVWIFGMICAFNHPTWDGLLRRADALPALAGNAIKGVVVLVCLFLLSVYNERIFMLPKEAYNALHPFTSLIPIFIFIVLRNISQTARMYHIHLFEWLGKITLETYISQYHIWMATTGINGSPKKLLQFIPTMSIEQYPLLSFTVASAVCLLVSHRLFNTTLVLKSYFLPSSMQPEQARRQTLVLGIWTAALYAAGWVVFTATQTGGAVKTPSSQPQS